MEYHKINSIFKRDKNIRIGRSNPMVFGEWSLPEFGFLQNNLWELTEKIDGTNIRVYWSGEAVRFAGRTDNAQIPTKLYDALNEIFTVDKMLSQFGTKEIVLYGEGVGDKIQGSHIYGLGFNFILFDVYCGGYWLSRNNVSLIGEGLNLTVAQGYEFLTLNHAIKMVESGLKSHYGNFLAEGVIARPAVDLFNRKGERIIAKIKTVDFIQE